MEFCGYTKSTELQCNNGLHTKKNKDAVRCSSVVVSCVVFKCSFPCQMNFEFNILWDNSGLRLDYFKILYDRNSFEKLVLYSYDSIIKDKKTILTELEESLIRESKSIEQN